MEEQVQTGAAPEIRSMLEQARLALRITTDALNGEISGLIDAALLDLSVAGVTVPENPAESPLILRAVITYVKMNFGEPDRMETYDRWKKSYDEQKAQLSMASGYTNWLEKT